MKHLFQIFICLLWAANSFAANAARVGGDLSVAGTLYLSDNSAITSSNGLLKNKGAWLIDTNYFAGDVVQVSGNSYVCTSANIGSTPPSANWSLFAASGVTPTITTETAGNNCAGGGVKIQLGTNTPVYICNGTAGGMLLSTTALTNTTQGSIYLSPTTTSKVCPSTNLSDCRTLIPTTCGIANLMVLSTISGAYTGRTISLEVNGSISPVVSCTITTDGGPYGTAEGCVIIFSDYYSINAGSLISWYLSGPTATPGAYIYVAATCK